MYRALVEPLRSVDQDLHAFFHTFCLKRLRLLVPIAQPTVQENLLFANMLTRQGTTWQWIMLVAVRFISRHFGKWEHASTIRSRHRQLSVTAGWPGHIVCIAPGNEAPQQWLSWSVNELCFKREFERGEA